MELLFCLLIILTFKQHRRGFSHMSFKESQEVFFFSDREGMEIWVDGEPSGVLAPAFLHFPAERERIFIEYKKEGLSFFENSVLLNHHKTMVFGHITPVINLWA